MCYNEPVSWATFFIGTLFTLLNFYKFKNFKEIIVISIYWFSAVTMQIWEALIHRYKNNQELCAIFSKSARINNFIQPMVLVLLLFDTKKYDMNFFIKALAVLVILTFYYNEFYPKNMIDKCGWTPKGIKYAWLVKRTPIIYVIVNVLLMYLLLKEKYRRFQIFLFIASLGLSFIIRYGYFSGSIWCWIAALLPLVNYIYFTYYNPPNR